MSGYVPDQDSYPLLDTSSDLNRLFDEIITYENS